MPRGGGTPRRCQRVSTAAMRTYSADGHRLDILVAEDNEVNQLVFTQILADTPYSFEIVGNGRRAVEAFSEMKPAHDPDGRFDAGDERHRGDRGDPRASRPKGHRMCRSSA